MVKVPALIAWCHWALNTLAGTLVVVPDAHRVSWALLSFALATAGVTVPVEVFTAVIFGWW